MRVCAFDVAIKTLSICIMDSPKYNDKMELIYSKPILWNLNNLLDEAPNCEYKDCVCPAKFYNELNKNYCGRHQSKGKTLNELKPIIVKSSDEYTPFEILLRLVKCLDQYPEVYDVDYIFIENQDDINPYMKMIASSIFSYYIKKAYIDKGENRRLKSINYISARKKLNNTPIIGQEYVSEKSTLYAQRKDSSIEYCRRYCNKFFPEFLIFFESNKKKDDTADSFMTCIAGIWSLHFDNVYPTITDEMIEKYKRIYNISDMNEKNRNKTKIQTVKEFQEKFVWIQ